MTVTLPENIPALQNLTETEVKRELALSLYAAKRITLVQAADLSSLNLFDFQSLLRDRRIPQHYDETDLEKDLLVLRELQMK
jgi:predicted HTH domain antitoxin